jgi:hypothetical protein
VLEKESQRHPKRQHGAGAERIGIRGRSSRSQKKQGTTHKKVSTHATTHKFHTNFFPSFYFYSSFCPLCVLCSSFVFGGQATGVPEWVWHFVTGTGGLLGSSLASLHRLSPNSLAWPSHKSPKQVHNPQWIEWPTFCLIQAVGLPSRPGPGRIAVVSCHAVARWKREEKMPLDWRVLLLLHCEKREKKAPLHGALTASDVMAPSQITPSNGTTCSLYHVLLCTQKME